MESPIFPRLRTAGIRPWSGEESVAAAGRRQRGVGDPRQLVGDYTNPILKSEAAEVVKKHGEMELSGVGAPTPANQCWPEPVPYIFSNVAMRMLRQPDKITIFYGGQFR
jgi:hypothetical protein